VQAQILNFFPDGALILDLGCGAGFLSNHLATYRQHTVWGLDSSPSSLEQASLYNPESRARYLLVL